MSTSTERTTLRQVRRTSAGGRPGRVGFFSAAALGCTLVLSGCADQGATGPPVNRAPVAAGAFPAETMVVGLVVEVDVAGLFIDFDRDQMAFTASSSAPSVVRIDMAGSTATLTAVATGSATITVTAHDPGGLSASLTADVAVG